MRLRGELKQEIDNLVGAMATGALRASPALAARLTAAEDELGRLVALAAKPALKVVDLSARLMVRFTKMLDRFEEYLARDPNRARAALRQVCGEIPLFPHESGKYLVARLGLSDVFLKAAVGSERFMVAGA